MIQDQGKDQSMISLILTFKRDIDTICAECFDNDAMFLYSIKESFETFINSRRSRPAELLARFMDAKLRAAAKVSKYRGTSSSSPVAYFNVLET